MKLIIIILLIFLALCNLPSDKPKSGFSKYEIQRLMYAYKAGYNRAANMCGNLMVKGDYSYERVVVEAYKDSAEYHKFLINIK